MYPSVGRGYMPFAPNSQQNLSQNKKREGKAVNEGKTMKKYQVTLRDRKGYTYTCIVKAEDAKSIPLLCDAKVVGRSQGKRCLVVSDQKNGRPRVGGLDLKFPIQLPIKEEEEDKKTGLLHSIVKFFREKTGVKSKKTSTGGKSKRRPKQSVQRKRQRTVSLKSNLDPIEESPEEEDEEQEDDGSYTHDSSSYTSENETDDSCESGCSSEISSIAGAECEELDESDDSDEDTDDTTVTSESAVTSQENAVTSDKPEP